MRSLPIFGIGLSFVLVGAGLLLFSLRKPAVATPEAPKKVKFRAGRVPVKRSAPNLDAERAAENKKLRIAGGALLALGVAVMAIS